MTSQRDAEILAFWFGDPDDRDFGKPRPVWFRKSPQFDGTLREQFLADCEDAAKGLLNSWKESPDSCLALILLLDQFPRNLFRGSPRAFSTDPQALDAAQHAIDRHFDRPMLPVQRWFFYLPFEHSESLAHQRQCVALFEQLRGDADSDSTIDYAYRHLRVIEQFGRFPHRNAILGRESTPEEEVFLQQPGSSF